jgi:serine/threonine protein kinase
MRRYSFSELSEATNSFNEDRNKRGVGAFGMVFEGQLPDRTRVAVKRGNPKSEQGRTEFETEIRLCSSLSHPNVVSLLGFCDEGKEMILVYEYMGQGTLAGRLYGSSSEPCLTWEERLEILIGAGTGLQYLHSCTDRGIIHRDVKGPNILLDDHLVAKMADYGVSKVGPEEDSSHVTTKVKGSFGFFDPEYFASGHLSHKSDVYSFGVVCLEALCAEKTVDEESPWKEVGLARWAKQKLKKEKRLRGIADKRIADTIRRSSMREFTNIVMKCLAEERMKRPSMEQVIEQLKTALQLQTSSQSSGPSSPTSLSNNDSSDDFDDTSDVLQAEETGAGTAEGVQQRQLREAETGTGNAAEGDRILEESFQ